jgi:hypothetical protein
VVVAGRPFPMGEGSLLSPTMEAIMSDRYSLDCRKMPSESNCSIYVEGTKDELLPLAMSHVTTVHGHPDNDETRSVIESAFEPV